MNPEFDWDPIKAATNYEKHEIRFGIAIQIWQDSHRTDEIDSRFDYGEIRWRTTGQLFDKTMVTVVYTLRDGTLRIISARKASRNERRKYRQGQTKT